MTGDIPDILENPHVFISRGVYARDGKDAQTDAQKIHAQKCKPETRDGKPDKDEHRDGPVGEAAAMDRRDHPQRYGDDEDDDHGRDIDIDGDGHSLLDLFPHRACIG